MPMTIIRCISCPLAMATSLIGMTAEEFEALALQCRDASFRQDLASMSVWVDVEATLKDCLRSLDGNLRGTHGTGNGTTAALEDDGLSYSFEVRKDSSMDDLASEGLPSTVVQARDIGGAMAHVQHMTSAFRFLRNACAACPTNQERCRDQRLLQLSRDVVLRCCAWSDVDDAPLARAVVLLAQISLQFSVNAITACSESQRVVWQLYFPDDFQKILVECHGHRKIVAVTAALILNCVNKQFDDEAVTQRRIDLVCARNLIITLLQRCLTSPQDRAATPAASVSVDDEDPAFEWICLLFRVLFQVGYSKDLYNAVGAHLLSRLWSRVTPEQLILLRMFTMWMTSNRNKPVTSDDIAAETQRRGAPVIAPAGHKDMYEFLTGTWVYVISLDEEDRPDDADTTRKVMWIELEHEAKLLLLDAMGELALDAVDASAAEAVNELLVSLLQELQRVWELRRLGPPSASCPGQTPASTSEEPFGYRSGLIRLIGNLCFRHSEHQDLVREGGYLPLFLNHCNIDEANPFLREWSLVALRNLCEGNEANQAYISALRPQGIDKSSVDLDGMNLDATLGENGKVRVSRKAE